jgi:hypothetical protein
VPAYRGLHHRLGGDVQAPGRRRLFRDHHPGARAVLTILIIGQQGYTGGVNGITDLRTLLGWDIRTDDAKYILYFVNCFFCSAMFAARFVLTSKLGRILLAVRDKEDRVRFSGYDVANFKIFVFCLAAAFAALGGAMFTLAGRLHVAVLRRHRAFDRDGDLRRRRRAACRCCRRGLRRAAVNWGKTLFSESFPELWLFAMGGLFIAVVLPSRAVSPASSPTSFCRSSAGSERRAVRSSRARRRRPRSNAHGQQHRLPPRT